MFPPLACEKPANDGFNGGGGNRTRAGFPPLKLSYVYFIRCGKTGPIKIGIADDLKTRLRMLQVGNHKPLHVHASARYSLEKARQIEKLLHSRLARSHIAGEWFRADPEVLEAALNPQLFVWDALEAQDRNRAILEGV